MSRKLIDKLKAYYKSHKDGSVYFYPLALLYYKNKQYDVAYQLLLDGLNKYPRYALALLLIGKILVAEENYDAAVAYLETAADIQRSNAEALKLLAKCYESVGEISKAVTTYEKVVKIEDDEFSKARLMELAGNVRPTEDVSRLIEKINEDEDTSEVPKIDLEEAENQTQGQDENEVTVTMAKLYEKQGYLKDAIETYKKILKKDPDNLEAKRSLNSLLSNSGLSDEFVVKKEKGAESENKIL